MSPEEIKTATDAAADAAERALCAASELSAIAGKMMPGTNNSAAVTLNGGGILAAVLSIIGVFACVIAVAAVAIAQAQNERMAESLSQLRHEVEKLSRDVELHGVYITEFRRQESAQQSEKGK